jgi:hypothetical protein
MCGINGLIGIADVNIAKQKVIAIADNFIQLNAFFTREIFNQYGLTIV